MVLFTKECRAVCLRILPEPVINLIRRRRSIQYRVEMILFPRAMKYFCPCCGTRLKAFVSGNYLDHPLQFFSPRYEKTEQNVHCPVCLSMPRHRILASWCDNHKELLHSASILYFAPEQSMMRWMKRNKDTCTTADLVKSADLRLDIQNTGLKDNSYDVIICNHVLEHVGDFRAALKEAKRILCPGGIFICSFPMDPKVEMLDEENELLPAEVRLQRFGQVDHRRVFGMKAAKFLTEAGFAVETIKGEDYPEEILPVVGPADYDINLLFCCRKDVIGETSD